MLSTPSTLTELKLHPPLSSGLIGEGEAVFTS